MTGAPADTLATARTPALLLDEERLAANVKRMNERAAALRVQLRPHLKTAKCLEVARLIFGGAVGPITVSTLKEAEFFVAGGFADLLYAVGFAVDKLDAVEALRERGGEVTVVLDHPTMAEALAQRCADLTRPLAIMIEIDTDGHRAGLRPDDARLDGVVRTVLAAPGLTLRGIMTHAGESYTSASTEEMRYWARRERDGAVHAAVRLRVLPNHACMTAAAYDAYRVHASAVSDEGSEALRTWYRCNGW